MASSTISFKTLGATTFYNKGFSCGIKCPPLNPFFNLQRVLINVPNQSQIRLLPNDQHFHKYRQVYICGFNFTVTVQWRPRRQKQAAYEYSPLATNQTTIRPQSNLITIDYRRCHHIRNIKKNRKNTPSE
jgi:hypothetical protein